MSFWKSKWVCILTSGHTVDGREVSAEVVVQLAETYDPNKYNARINIEHSEYSPKLGSVEALKVEDHGEEKKLFAQLKPNDYLLYLIQRGQKLHTSCEIVGDFAKTGKAYLTGLAMTDSPASLGTTEMHLSIEGEDSKAQFFSSSEEIKGEKTSTFENLFNKQEEELMNKAVMDLLNQIHANQAETATVLTSISGTLIKLSGKPSPSEPAKPEESKPEETPDKVSLSALAEQVKLLSSSLSDSQKAFTDLTEKLSDQTDEQHRDQATGSNSEATDVY